MLIRRMDIVRQQRSLPGLWSGAFEFTADLRYLKELLSTPPLFFLYPVFLGQYLFIAQSLMDPEYLFDQLQNYAALIEFIETLDN